MNAVPPAIAPEPTAITWQAARAEANAKLPGDALDFIAELSKIELTLCWIYRHKNQDIEQGDEDIRAEDWRRLDDLKAAAKEVSKMVRQRFHCAWETP